MTKKLLMNNHSENGLSPVMDGLICWLDGRDGKFGDTVWKDRSGNGNDATVTNCVWTGKTLKTTSDLSEFLISKEMISGNNTPYTLEVYFSRYATDRPSTAENVIIANSVKQWFGSTSVYISGRQMFYDVGHIPILTTSEFNKPYQVTIVKNDAKNRKSFLNGEFIQERTISNDINGISFFGNWDTEKIKGNYYSIRLYNRVLTEEEVKQNYLYEQSVERDEVYDNVFAEYTFDNTIEANCLPTSITIGGGYKVVDEIQGNITRRVLKGVGKNIPTAISFRDKRALLTVDNLVAKPTTAQYMFYNCGSLTTANLSNLDTSDVTIMSNMLENCRKLTSVNLSNFDTSKVITMAGMFAHCSLLTTLNLSGFNTSKLQNMGGMCHGCISLANLDLTSFAGSNVTNMGNTFYGCISLYSLDLSSFDTTNVASMQGTFNGCSNLTSELVIRNSKMSIYSLMFNNTSTNPNSKFTVKYIDEPTKAMAEKLVATKSQNSNVVLADTPTN